MRKTETFFYSVSVGKHAKRSVRNGEDVEPKHVSAQASTIQGTRRCKRYSHFTVQQEKLVGYNFCGLLTPEFFAVLHLFFLRKSLKIYVLIYISSIIQCTPVHQTFFQVGREGSSSLSDN